MVNEMGHRWTKLNASIKDCCTSYIDNWFLKKQPKNLAMCDRPSLSMTQLNNYFIKHENLKIYRNKPSLSWNLILDIHTCIYCDSNRKIQ